MSQRIVVPIEGNAHDVTVLTIARHIARHLSAEIVLIHVAPALFNAKDIISAERYLDEYTQALRTEGIEAHFLMEYGDPSAEIADAARRQQAQMIVVAPEQRKLFQTLWNPRVSIGLLHSATVPLFIVPDEVPADEILAEPDARVILALDGSANAEAALPIATQIAQSYQRPLLLVRVVAPVFILGSGVEAVKARHDAQYAKEVEAHRYLVDTRQRIAAETQIQVEIAEKLGPVADQLVRLAASRPGSVLVMGTHGRSGLARVLVGSIAAQVMSRATTPTVIVPSHATDDTVRQ